MKKLLLASLLAFGSMVPMAAAEFSVLFQDKPIENGSTVKFDEYTVTEQGYEGFEDKFYSWKVDPELYLVSDAEGPLTVHAVSQNGEEFQLCAGGNCIMGTDLIKNAVMPEVNVPLNLQLDWAKNTINEPEIFIPALEIFVEVYYNNAPSNKLTFTLQMGGFEAAGVVSIVADAGSVVLNGKTLQYDLAGPSQISVYSLSGKTVLNKAISGSGSISLDGLSKGVYLYRLSGKSNKAAKFIIK